MKINPFNPQLPARPDFFVGREPEIIQFEKYLLQTMNGSPMNMAITGNRGIGKTSILIKFQEIATAKKCLVIRLSNYEGNISNIEEFSDFISSNIKAELLSHKPFDSKIENFASWVRSLKPEIQWNDFKISVERKTLVQEYFRKRLIKLWEEIKQDFIACVILIDEAESLEKIEGIMQFFREVFQRISIEANYMIVLAGKLNFTERMSESFSPLNRFFPSCKLEQFNESEIRTYIQRKLNTVNISINEDAIKLIISYSEGHPYVLVAMCYIIFDSLLENEDTVTKNIFERALQKIYNELAKDFFSPMYHPLTPKAKMVLFKICFQIEKLDFTFHDACLWTGMKRNYVSPYIQELLRKGILNKPERGKYQIFHSLFIGYVKSRGNEP